MDTEAKERLRLVDLIIPVIAVGYAVYYIISVSDFPFQAQLTGVLLGTILTILCVSYFVRFALQARRHGTRPGINRLFGDGTMASKRLIFIGLGIASIAIAPYAGFTITTFLFLTASFVATGVRPASRAVIAAAVAALAGWLFFIVLLGTRFPAGPFEKLVNQVF